MLVMIPFAPIVDSGDALAESCAAVLGRNQQHSPDAEHHHQAVSAVG